MTEILLKEHAPHKLEAKKKKINKKRKMLHDSGHCIDTNPVLFFTCFGDSTKPVDFPVPKFSLCFDINDVPNTLGGYVKVFTHITELSRENKNLDNHLLTNKVYPKYGIEVE